ncbi:MAG: hypothetical protein ACP5NQ_02150 [Vulcanisaeta sp.]
MSVLVRSYDDVSIECDTNYGKYIINGVNYVPCTIKGQDLDRAINILKNYILGNAVLKELIINALGNDEVSIKIPVTVLSRGKSIGEIIDSLVYLLIGVRQCLNTLGK